MTVIKDLTTAVTKTPAYAKKIAKAKSLGKSEVESEEYQKQLEIAAEEYRNTLRRDIEQVRAKSTIFISGVSVDLMRTFVDMDLSYSQRVGDYPTDLPDKIKQGSLEWQEQNRDQTPEVGLSYAKAHGRVFVIIGEPGSGKTTLLQYYALKCLDDDYENMGYESRPIPIFYRLRELDFEKGKPIELASALQRWKEGKGKAIAKEVYEEWLSKQNILVLLDGLDEIRELEQRRKICRWLQDIQCGTHGKEVLFVLTSRETGFRKMDGVELDCDYVRADLCGFNWAQQQVFIKKWFDAACLKNDNKGALIDGEEKLQDEAKHYANNLIAYLEDEKNSVVRKLTTTPVILQITAMLYKNKGIEFSSRSQLYVAALDYLLEGRDRNKDQNKFKLQTSDTLAIMQALAVYMQNEIKHDAISVDHADDLFKQELKGITKIVSAREFADYIVNWAGLLTSINASKDYVFHHKTFREYLVALSMSLRLFEEVNNTRIIDILIEGFDDNWWEEIILFLMDMNDGERFDKFWQAFFVYHKNTDFTKAQENKILFYIESATRCKVSFFSEQLLDENLKNDRKLLMVSCLSKVDKPNAYEALWNYVKHFSQSDEVDTMAYNRAVEVLRAHTDFDLESLIARSNQRDTDNKQIYNQHEYNAEYILIPKGNYNDKSKDGLGKQKTDAIYFAKYPVTNRQYNQFIIFLSKESDYRKLSYKAFSNKIMDFAASIAGNYVDYLNSDKWSDLLRSKEHENKRFNGDEQPVVGISWYAAKAYTFWLSCLAVSKQKKFNNIEVGTLANIFRLPDEKEWLWAAGRLKKGNKLKKYPWCTNDEPSEELANYGQNISKTSSVGSYPKGSTIDGLMDMAGNVWEWQDNWYDVDEAKYRAVRGGSWYLAAVFLPCSARSNYNPDYRNYSLGFRVVRQSKLIL